MMIYDNALQNFKNSFSRFGNPFIIEYFNVIPIYKIESGLRCSFGEVSFSFGNASSPTLGFFDVYEGDFVYRFGDAVFVFTSFSSEVRELSLSQREFNELMNNQGNFFFGGGNYYSPDNAYDAFSMAYFGTSTMPNSMNFLTLERIAPFDPYYNARITYHYQRLRGVTFLSCCNLDYSSIVRLLGGIPA